MQKTILTILLLLFFSFSLKAGENFSEMSTQELISIMGYVKKAERKKFKAELKSRLGSMSASEKSMYEKNKEKLKK